MLKYQNPDRTLTSIKLVEARIFSMWFVEREDGAFLPSRYIAKPKVIRKGHAIVEHPTACVRAVDAKTGRTVAAGKWIDAVALLKHNDAREINKAIEKINPKLAAEHNEWAKKGKPPMAETFPVLARNDFYDIT